MALLRGKTDVGFGGIGRKLKQQTHHKRSASLSMGESLTREDTLFANMACGLKEVNSGGDWRAQIQPMEDTHVLSVSPTMESPENLDINIGAASPRHGDAHMLLQASENRDALYAPPKTYIRVQKDTSECLPIALNARLRELPAVPYHHRWCSAPPSSSSSPSSTGIGTRATTDKQRYSRPQNVPVGARAPPNSPVGTYSRSTGRASTYARAAWGVDAGRFTSLVGLSKAIMEDNVRVLRCD